VAKNKSKNNFFHNTANVFELDFVQFGLRSLKITTFRYMRSLLAILLLLLLSGGGWGLKAQDLTGQWTGSATDNLSDKSQKLVLTITEADSSFGGVLHWYFPETQYIGHLIVSGRFYRKDSVLRLHSIA